MGAKGYHTVLTLFCPGAHYNGAVAANARMRANVGRVSVNQAGSDLGNGFRRGSDLKFADDVFCKNKTRDAQQMHDKMLVEMGSESK